MASITWHVSTLAAAVLCGLLILAPITDASADIRIGSISNIDSSDTVINGVTLDAPIMAASRAKLLDPEHFRGEGDAFPPRVVTITDVVKDASTGTVLTPEVLADLDVFFVGQFSQEVLTLGERDLLRDFVVKGGTLIVTCDIEGFDEVCNHFGYETVAGFRLVGEATYYVGKNHQLFTEPFRIEDAELPLTEDGVQGRFVGGAAFGDGMVLARTKFVPDAVVVLIEMGRGRVVLLSNAQMISSTPSDVTVSPGTVVDTVNDKFLINLFALGAPAYTSVVAAAHDYACRAVKKSTRLDPRPTVYFEDPFGTGYDARLDKRAKILCQPVDLAGGPRPDAPSLTCFEADAPRSHHGRLRALFKRHDDDDDDDHRWKRRHGRSEDDKHGAIVSHEFDDEQTLVVGRAELVCVVSETEVVEADVARGAIKWERYSERKHARHSKRISRRRHDDDDDDDDDDD